MVVVDETPTQEKVRGLHIAKWTWPQDVQIQKLHMGIVEEPKYLKINVDLKQAIVITTKKLLHEFA